MPRADEHQGEYVADRSARLKWLTGFSGSAGVAHRACATAPSCSSTAATRCRCASEVDLDIFAIESLVDNPPAGLDQGQSRQGCPARLRPVAAHDRRGQGAESLGRAIRRDAGAARQEPDRHHLEGSARTAAGAGRDPPDRLCRRTGQGQAGAAGGGHRQGRRHACRADRPVLDRLGLQHPRRRRAAHAAGARLRGARRRRQAPAVHGPAQVLAHGRGLSHPARRICTSPANSRRRSQPLPRAARRSRSTRCWRRKSCRMLVEDNGGTVVAAPDPARIPRATKNPAEIAGSRAAHRRDGAAVAKLLCWLDRQKPGTLDEIAVVTKLEEIRRPPARKRRCRCATSPSTPFPAPGRTAPSCTTASRAPPTASSATGELFLLDSGGQYQDGTTDITRTVPIGTADRGDARALHAGAEGHDRHFDAALSRRHARLRDRRGGAHGAVEARLRLRPRHRPWRRLLSRRA